MAELIATLHFPARAEELQAMRERVREILLRLNCPPHCIDETVLGLNEACMNIIQHAYGTHQMEGDIVLEICEDDAFMLFRLTDFAPPVDKSKCCSRDLDDVRPGGLGMHFINSLMDEARFIDPPDGIGNILELRKKMHT